MVGEIIDRHHDDIVERWIAAMRRRPVARDLPRERLVDHLPRLLARIGAQATRGTSGTVGQGTTRTHALQWLTEGFALGDLVAEFSTLRQVVMEVLAEDGRVTSEERASSTPPSTTRCASRDRIRARERALERLTLETAGSRSLDDLLARLVNVLSDASPAVDEVTIRLASEGRLIARASIGLERQQTMGFSLAIGEGFAGTIAATRRELSVRDAANAPAIVSDDIRRERLRALFGVPLIAEGDLVGVMHMGSRTAYKFSEEDVVVFRAAAARVTTLIVEATLRERERRALEAAERAGADAARELRILSGIFETSIDVVLVLDRHSRLVLPSPRVARLFGRRPEETVRRTLCEIALPNGDLSRVERDVARVFSTEKPVRGVADMPTTMGMRRFEYSLSPIPGDDAPLVVCVARDVTEERRVEAALRQSEARFRVLVQASSMAVWLSEDYGRRHVDSPSWRDLTGQTLEEYLGWGFRAAIHGDDLPHLMDAWNAAVAEGTMMECEYRLRTSDGRWRWTHARAVPVAEASGTRREWLGMNVAVTRLTQATEDRERVMAVLGHDLRNPLNAITLAASLLARADDIPPARRATAERIVRGAARMAQMIADLAIHHRHHEIEEDEARAEPVAEEAQRLFAVRGGGERVALVGEDLGDPVSDVVVVVDDEDGSCGRHGLSNHAGTGSREPPVRLGPGRSSPFADSFFSFSAGVRILLSSAPRRTTTDESHIQTSRMMMPPSVP
jgi:PAS domain S-box-containing protein